ncbi:hypothetical protein [Streptomyces sp. NPDC048106]|uniref:hypothetical protein n=1 Tax=Streptomyces sp. NPDC048106 TaxID=3155750 RepID=UPI00345574ED
MSYDVECEMSDGKKMVAVSVVVGVFPVVIYVAWQRVADQRTQRPWTNRRRRCTLVPVVEDRPDRPK